MRKKARQVERNVKKKKKNGVSKTCKTVRKIYKTQSGNEFK